MSVVAQKRVLFVITKSNWGGAQQYVYTLATHLKKTGTEVAVVLGGTGEPGASAGLLAQKLETQGVRTIFLKSFARDVDSARERVALQELLEVIRREQPTILHLNSSKAGGLGALAGRILNVPQIIFTAHGWPHREPRSSLSRALIWLASWATIVLSHRVIAVSDYDCVHAPIIFSREKMRVVHNGIALFPLATRIEARQTIAAKMPSIERLPFWFVAVGELHPNKGFDILIKAFAEVASQQSDAALVIIGEGAERETLEAHTKRLGLSDRICFAGFVPDARRLLSGADSFVLSSRKEGLPFVILEAGMARAPIIATAVGAVPEVILDGCGRLVRPSDSRVLAHALEESLTDQDSAVQMSERLRARVIRDFSEQEMLNRTFALYA